MTFQRGDVYHYDTAAIPTDKVRFSHVAR
jgi:hypothetical protein